MSTKQSAPIVVLVEPQLGENIGTAARAMANFGLTELRLVAPRDGWPNKKAISAAAGATAVLDRTTVFETFEEAIADLHFLAATTARPRDLVKTILTPDVAVVDLQHRAADGQKCGMLFGGERNGLNNDHIARADIVVMVPVAPMFASLNLAQAVLLIGYEWLKQTQAGTLGRETIFDDRTRIGLTMKGSRLATKAEFTGFYEHLEQELDASGFLRPPEKRPAMVRNIRTMFERIAVTEQEIRTLRGIVASLARSHKRRSELP